MRLPLNELPPQSCLAFQSGWNINTVVIRRKGQRGVWGVLASLCLHVLAAVLPPGPVPHELLVGGPVQAGLCHHYPCTAWRVFWQRRKPAWPTVTDPSSAWLERHDWAHYMVLHPLCVMGRNSDAQRDYFLKLLTTHAVFFTL